MPSPQTPNRVYVCDGDGARNAQHDCIIVVTCNMRSYVVGISQRMSVAPIVSISWAFVGIHDKYFYFFWLNKSSESLEFGFSSAYGSISYRASRDDTTLFRIQSNSLINTSIDSSICCSLSFIVWYSLHCLTRHHQTRRRSAAYERWRRNY